MDKKDFDNIRIKFNDHIRSCQEIVLMEKNNTNKSKMESDKATMLFYFNILDNNNQTRQTEHDYKNHVLYYVNNWLN